MIFTGTQKCPRDDLVITKGERCVSKSDAEPTAPAPVNKDGLATVRKPVWWGWRQVGAPVPAVSVSTTVTSIWRGGNNQTNPSWAIICKTTGLSRKDGGLVLLRLKPVTTKRNAPWRNPGPGRQMALWKTLGTVGEMWVRTKLQDIIELMLIFLRQMLISRKGIWVFIILFFKLLPRLDTSKHL